MTLNVGLNNLYPTDVMLSKIDIKQEYIDQSIMSVIHPELNQTVVDIFDNYIRSTLPNETINSWDYEIQGWVNRYHLNEMEYHTHSGAALSTVVYLINDAEGGEITFYDPRHFAARGYDMKFRPLFDPTSHKPLAGDVVTFPSYLYHAVRPTKGLRISAAFDLYLSDKEVKE